MDNQVNSENENTKLNTDIYKKVKDIIVKNLKIDEAKVVETANFKDDLKMDSLEQAELIMDLEKAFDCTINEEAAEKIKTVSDAVLYLESIKK